MIKGAILSAIRRLGYDLVLFNNAESERRYIDIFERVRPCTISSYERIYALVDATRYILKNDIQGAFVECGVYRGGSMMAVAIALMAEGAADRDLYLFDTFEGMPAPDDRDIDFRGRPASDAFSKSRISDVRSTLLNCSLDKVAAAMASTGYPAERIHLVKGLVEHTIPEQVPASIALLRLDTDWYSKPLKSRLGYNLVPRSLVLSFLTVSCLAIGGSHFRISFPVVPGSIVGSRVAGDHTRFELSPPRRSCREYPSSEPANIGHSHP